MLSMWLRLTVEGQCGGVGFTASTPNRHIDDNMKTVCSTNLVQAVRTVQRGTNTAGKSLRPCGVKSQHKLLCGERDEPCAQT